jgi:UDP-glucose 6-dehydrogenase
MDLKEQLEICYRNYKKWKEKAFLSSDENAKEALERAFFWLEMHSAFFVVGVLEKAENSKENLQKILAMKIKLLEKLSEYAKTLKLD